MSNDKDAEVEVAQPSDDEVFASAAAPEPAEKPEADAEVATEQASDTAPVSRETEPPARGPDGKFAAKPETPVGDTPPNDDARDGQIPAWRLREEADNRRRVEAELAETRRQIEELRRNPPKPAETPKPEAKPDPLLDPEGYEAYVLSKVEARFATAAQERAKERGEESMQAARASNTAVFDKAYAEAAELLRGGDAVTHARIFNARDPGKELLAWYQERETLRSVGTDPNAWLERQLAEAAKDPAKAEKFLGLLRGQAQQQQQPAPTAPRQAAPVQLPPSLSRLSSAPANRSDNADYDDSDEAIFQRATTG